MRNFLFFLGLCFLFVVASNAYSVTKRYRKIRSINPPVCTGIRGENAKCEINAYYGQVPDPELQKFGWLSKFLSVKKKNGATDNDINETRKKISERIEHFYDKKVEYLPGHYTFTGPYVLSMYREKDNYKTIITTFEESTIGRDTMEFPDVPLGAVAVIRDKNGKYIVSARGIGYYEKDGDKYVTLTEEEAKNDPYAVRVSDDKIYKIKKDYQLQFLGGFADFCERKYIKKCKSDLFFKKTSIGTITRKAAAKEITEELLDLKSLHLKEKDFKQIGFITVSGVDNEKKHMTPEYVGFVLYVAQTDLTFDEIVSIRKEKVHEIEDFLEAPVLIALDRKDLDQQLGNEEKLDPNYSPIVKDQNNEEREFHLWYKYVIPILKEYEFSKYSE